MISLGNLLVIEMARVFLQFRIFFAIFEIFGSAPVAPPKFSDFFLGPLDAIAKISKIAKKTAKFQNRFPSKSDFFRHFFNSRVKPEQPQRQHVGLHRQLIVLHQNAVSFKGRLFGRENFESEMNYKKQKFTSTLIFSARSAWKKLALFKLEETHPPRI